MKGCNRTNEKHKDPFHTDEFLADNANLAKTSVKTLVIIRKFIEVGTTAGDGAKERGGMSAYKHIRADFFGVMDFFVLKFGGTHIFL